MVIRSDIALPALRSFPSQFLTFRAWKGERPSVVIVIRSMVWPPIGDEMGIQELMYGVGIVLLACGLIFGIYRAGRRPQSERSKQATKQMYNDNQDT